jgi:hypothetical protein
LSPSIRFRRKSGITQGDGLKVELSFFSCNT